MRRRVGILLAGLWVGLVLWSAFRSGRSLFDLLGWVRTTGPGFLPGLLVLVGAWGLGRPTARWILPDFADADRIARSLLELSLGLAVLQTGAVALGLLGLFSAPTAGGLLVLGLLAGELERRRGPPRPLPSRAEAPGPSGGVALAAAGGMLLTTLFAVGAPPLAADEILYHFRFIEHLVTAGGFLHHPLDAESAFAQGLHALAAIPAALGGEGAVRPFGWMLSVLGLLAGERVARRAFGPEAAVLYLPIAVGATSLVRFLPGLGTDFPLMLPLAVATMVVLDWIQAPGEPEGRPWALAVLGGFALSIKFTAPLFFAPLYVAAGGMVLFGAREDRRRRALLALVGAALLPALFAMPWLIRNAVHFGHPLYPLAGLADGDQAELFVFNFTANYGAGEGPLSVLAAPWELFVHGAEFDRRLYLGRMNVWPLLALPAVLATRVRAGRALLIVAALGLLAWSTLLRRAIYLVPLWPVLAALCAGALTEATARLAPPACRLALPLLLFTAVLLGGVEIARPWAAHLADVSVSTGRTTAEGYRREHLPAESVHAWVREHVPKDALIANLFNSKVHGLERRTVFAGAEEVTPLRVALARAGSAEAFAELLARHGVGWAVYRRPVHGPEMYPMLDEAQWEAGFAAPMRIAAGVLESYGVLRHEGGGYELYELSGGPFSRRGGQSKEAPGPR